MNANEQAIAEANRIGSLARLDAFLDSLQMNPEISQVTLNRIHRLYLARKAERNSPIFEGPSDFDC
jgi:hypothetical protein